MATKELPKLEAQRRDKIGSRYSKRLREQGRIPAVIYGHNQEPDHVSLDRHALDELLHHHAHLIEAQLDSKAEPVLIKDIQLDHMGTTIVHADLARVDLSEEVEVELEVVLEGEPAALNDIEGAILNHPVTEVTVSCRADSIPDSITHDITSLGADQAVTAGDLVLPQGVKLVTDPETVIAQIQVMEEVAEEGQAAEGEAEPEVIGKGGEEGEAQEKE